MSGSYKKQPFMSVCGNSSAKRDKVRAHKGQRRTNNRIIKSSLKYRDFDELSFPHRIECPHNKVCVWVRDGKQIYQTPTQDDWLDYLDGKDSWPPMWYKQMMRK